MRAKWDREGVRRIPPIGSTSPRCPSARARVSVSVVERVCGDATALQPLPTAPQRPCVALLPTRVRYKARESRPRSRSRSREYVARWQPIRCAGPRVRQFPGSACASTPRARAPVPPGACASTPGRVRRFPPARAAVPLAACAASPSPVRRFPSRGAPVPLAVSRSPRGIEARPRTSPGRQQRAPVPRGSDARHPPMQPRASHPPGDATHAATRRRREEGESESRQQLLSAP